MSLSANHDELWVCRIVCFCTKSFEIHIMSLTKLDMNNPANQFNSLVIIHVTQSRFPQRLCVRFYQTIHYCLQLIKKYKMLVYEKLYLAPERLLRHFSLYLHFLYIHILRRRPYLQIDKIIHWLTKMQVYQMLYLILKDVCNILSYNCMFSIYIPSLRGGLLQY